MDIADKFQKIRLLLAEYRFIAILKKLSVPFVSMVESNGITGEKTPHDSSDGSGTCSKQEMKMIWDESPGKTGGGGIEQNIAESFQKAVTVGIVSEYAFFLDSSTDNMMQGARSVYASFARHSGKITPVVARVNL